MSKLLGWSLAALLVGAALLTQACAASPDLNVLLPEVRPAGFWLICTVTPSADLSSWKVPGDTGGEIPIPGGQRLLVPDAAIPDGDIVDFFVFRPGNGRVMVRIDASDQHGDPVATFDDSLTLTLSYNRRGCRPNDGTALDTSSLYIYRITPGGRTRLPKTAASDSTVSTKINSLSTFAIGG